MSALEFLDRHWGFWFAIFLLMLAGILIDGAVALFAIVVELVRR